MCVHVCVCACVCACVYVYVCVNFHRGKVDIEEVASEVSRCAAKSILLTD